MHDAQVILEVPGSWLDHPLDGPRHQRFFTSILMALSDLGVTVRPIPLVFAADNAPRITSANQLVISYHSKGPADNILRLKESYVPPYYVFDRLGYSGFSELSVYPERFMAAIDATPIDSAEVFVKEIAKELREKNASKYDQANRIDMHLPEHFVFQPLQTIDDPVAELAVLEQLDVLAEVASATEALGWSVVVKRHPFCTARSVTKRINELSIQYPNLIESNASIHTFINRAQAVIGANSGVLFEALIQGAHVISFGKSEFSQVTTSITRLSEIPSALLGRGRVERARQVKFLAWYLTRYCVRADDVKAISDRIAEALNGLNIQTLDLNQPQRKLFNSFADIENHRRNSIKDEIDN